MNVGHWSGLDIGEQEAEWPNPLLFPPNDEEWYQWGWLRRAAGVMLSAGSPPVLGFPTWAECCSRKTRGMETRRTISETRASGWPVVCEGLERAAKWGQRCWWRLRGSWELRSCTAKQKSHDTSSNRCYCGKKEIQNTCTLGAQSEELGILASNTLLRKARVKCELQRENRGVQEQVSTAGQDSRGKNALAAGHPSSLVQSSQL